MFGKKVQFNRHEISGSFGDIGTNLPLIVGMIAVNLNSAIVLIMFGVVQIIAGFLCITHAYAATKSYGSIIFITQKIPGEILFGAGLSIDIFMLIIALNGGLSQLARLISLCVVRGIQFG